MMLVRLGVEAPVVVRSVAYGDPWPNMVQPFWTIPLLATAGRSVRDALGYAFFMLTVTGAIFAVGLWLVAPSGA